MMALYVGVRDFLTAVWRDTGGAIAVMAIVSLSFLIGFAALAIDMSYAYWTRTQLQHASSAAALAGILDLIDESPADDQPDTSAYRDLTVAFAYKNMPQIRHGAIINSVCGSYDPITDTVTASTECDDVKAGNWDPDTRTFTPWDDAGYNPATMELDAVMVRTRTSAVNGNPLNLFLAGAVGLAQTDITTVAIATIGGGGVNDCYLGGIVAGGSVPSGSDNTYLAGFCVYGHDGVEVGSNNTFEPGVTLGMDEADGIFLAGSDNVNMPAPSYPDLVPSLAEMVSQLIDDYSPGGPEQSFAHCGTLPSGTIDIASLGTNCAYNVLGDATIPSNSTLSDVAIFAIGTVTVGSGSSAVLPEDYDMVLENVFLAGYRVQVGSYVRLGQTDYCDTGDGEVTILALENILIGSNNYIYGGQVIAGGLTDMQSNLWMEGTAVQAVDNAKFQSDTTFSVCDVQRQHEIPILTADLAVRLVH